MNKTELLFQMLEQPGEYTTEEWQEILADDECRELYTMMSKTQSALDAARADEDVTDDTIASEWRRLTAARPHSLFSSMASDQRVAASFIGILFVSSIAFAAVHIVRQNQRSEAPKAADTTVVTRPHLPAPTSSLPQDTLTIAPKLYDNVPLEQMLAELSAYYSVKVAYRRDAARQLRLFYQWRPEYTLEKVVEMLNNFESLQLQLDGDTLFVSSPIDARP